MGTSKFHLPPELKIRRLLILQNPMPIMFTHTIYALRFAIHVLVTIIPITTAMTMFYLSVVHKNFVPNSCTGVLSTLLHYFSSHSCSNFIFSIILSLPPLDCQRKNSESLCLDETKLRWNFFQQVFLKELSKDNTVIIGFVFGHTM